MLTELYLQTTNPKLTLGQFFSAGILSGIFASAIFHAIVYAGTLNLTSYVFLGNPLSLAVNTRLFVALLVIMSFGYLARFFHVKDIYRAYNQDEEATREHLDKLYIGWIFIA
jgi:hypothetical protein